MSTATAVRRSGTRATWTSGRPWVATVVRLVLAAVWFLAGLAKLDEPRAFLRVVRVYDATPEWLSKAIAYGLPVLEICLAVLLLVGLATRYAAIVSAVLLGIFLIGIVQASIRGIKLECGCFGRGGATTAGNTTYLLDVARDLGLLALATFLILWPLSRLSVDERIAAGHQVAPPSAKRLRRDPKAIQRFQAMQAARNREIRSRQRYLALTAGVVVLLTCLIGVSVQAGRSKIQGSLEAANASTANGVVVGKSTAPVTVAIYEDFQCPICEQFESTTAADLTKLINAGTIKIQYHMMAFLDSSSNGNRYSSRSANAALCASDANVDTFAKYHAVLFGKDSKGQKVQPEEGSQGRTDGELQAYFKQALPKATVEQTSTFSSCVGGETHAALVQAITDAASKHGVSGTPTAYVAGKKITNVTRDSVLSAITAAQKTAGATPSASPSP